MLVPVTLPITGTIAGATALVLLWLSTRVSARRMKSGINSGDGGDPHLQAAIRSQANLTEYAPTVLILLGLLELSGQGATAQGAGLWAAGAAFVLARLSHPLGMDRPAPNPLRAGGILVTWIVLLVLAGWTLAVAYRAMG